MGRYYSCNADMHGKFWFGVQPSFDVEDVFGLERTSGKDDDNNLTSYGEDIEKVKHAIDEQFDILQVPLVKRRYQFDMCHEIGNYVWDDIWKFFLTRIDPKDGSIPYCMSSDGDGTTDDRAWPRSPKRMLAASRVQLGLIIYNAMRIDGYCDMEWEA